jgi:hypothetical protein
MMNHAAVSRWFDVYHTVDKFPTQIYALVFRLLSAKFSKHTFSSAVKGLCARFWRFSVAWPHALMVVQTHKSWLHAHVKCLKLHWHL